MTADIKTIKETSKFVVEIGKKRIEKSTLALMLQGILAGIFIGLGAIALLKIGSLAADPGLGVFLGSAVFPVGIILILLLDSELFTSNTMMMMGVYNRVYKLRRVLLVLSLVWVANLIGMIIISALSAYSGIFSDSMIQKISSMAVIKTSMPIYKMLISAVLCNIIVCTGVWTAYSMKNAGAKILILWLVITVFALSGTEHIVANMYFLFTAKMLGSDISFAGICLNLLIVTIGNFIGGAFIITGINKIIISSKRVKMSSNISEHPNK